MLLGLAGLVIAIPTLYAEPNIRRWGWTAVLLCYFAAILSYIWGDPVRGPFANLIHLKSPERFDFQAGVTCGFPIKKLAEGIDFSQCISIPGEPIKLWVRKTWWSGLQVQLSVVGPGKQNILVYSNKELKYLAPDADFNHDDYALEFVAPSRAPFLQLVLAEDYTTVYLNTILRSATSVMILKDNRLLILPPEEAKKPENKLDRIFKYPSYDHAGMRE
jgi:hypothetical protein